MKHELELIEVYQQLKKREIQGLFNRSRHWQRFNDKKIDPATLKNFRAAGLSRGNDDANKSTQTVSLLRRVLVKVGPEFLTTCAHKENIGNAPGAFEYNNVVVTWNDLHHIAWAHLLARSITRGVESYLEIGAGYGSFAAILHRIFKFRRLVFIDLPEGILQTAFYLKSTFPDVGLNFNSPLKAVPSSETPDIYFFTPDMVLDDFNFDIVVNARSFAEMSKVDLERYFKDINKMKPDCVFFNLNRYRKSTSGDDIWLYQYPYNPFWNVLISESAFCQPLLHLLICSKSPYVSSSIQQELLRLRYVCYFSELFRKFRRAVMWFNNFRSAR